MDRTRRDVAIEWLTGWAIRAEAVAAFGDPASPDDLDTAQLDERCLVELGEDDFLAARSALAIMF